MACTCESSYSFLCKECRLADDTYELLEQRDDAYGYLSRLFRYYAPQCEPLQDLPGLATQIDNLLVGMAAQRDELVTALRTVIREWEQEDVSVIAINAARAAVAKCQGAMSDADALKTCPFCGGKAGIVECHETDTRGGFVVCCERCEASTRVWFPVKNEVSRILREAWNRRVPPNSFQPRSEGS